MKIKDLGKEERSAWLVSSATFYAQPGTGLCTSCGAVGAIRLTCLDGSADDAVECLSCALLRDLGSLVLSPAMGSGRLSEDRKPFPAPHGQEDANTGLTPGTDLAYMERHEQPGQADPGRQDGAHDVRQHDGLAVRPEAPVSPLAPGPRASTIGGLVAAEARGDSPEPLEMPGTMPRVCCACGATYGTKPCIREMDGQPSHGICGDPECFAAALRGEKRTR